MADFLHVDFDTADLEADLDQIAVDAQTAIRPAAQAGSQVFYEEVKRRAPVNKKDVKKKGGRIIKPGALRASIYQVYSKDHSTQYRAEYHISWNHKKAPHGHLVEFGTSRAPAHPFLRPSFDARGTAALEAVSVTFDEHMLQGHK